jgi:hypothetical protein
LSGVFLGG